VGKKYKLKTHKGTAKRFRITGTGKVMRTRGGKSHFRRRRTSRIKSKLARVQAVATSAQARRIKRLAPYLRRYRQNPPA
jgi:large subunit ribosomal protein L35